MRRAGFTLIELIVALSLSWLCAAALMSLLVPMLQRQTRAMGSAAAQGDALLAYKGLLGQVAAASEVYLPAASAGVDALSDVLTGCSNFSSTLAAQLDGARPSGSFMACVADGSLYLKTVEAGPVCPPPAPAAPAACAASGGQVLARNLRYAAGYTSYFVRRRGVKNSVEVHYEVRYGQAVQAVDQTMAFETASGGNQ